MPFLTTLAFTLALAGQAPAAQNAPSLKVGDPAPPLAISKWVKGSPVEQIGKDGTYVVEFWATWCGPCFDTIPHLTKLQKENPDVKFIGVSIWEPDRSLVEPFVQKMGQRMDYSIGMDKADEKERGRDGAMAVSWMSAAQAPGIPTAFIVKDGTIQWMGHPFEMDEPLEQIVAGEFDQEAYAARQAKIAGLLDDLQKLQQAQNPGDQLPPSEMDKLVALAQEAADLGNPWALMNLHQLQMQKGDRAAADATLQRMLETGGVRNYALFTQFLVLLQDQKLEEAYKVARLAFGEMGDHPMMNNFAWIIVDPETPIENRDVDLAIEIAKKSIEWKGTYANHRTLARAYFLKGDKAKAVEHQKLAISLAPDRMKNVLTQTLKEYEG